MTTAQIRSLVISKYGTHATYVSRPDSNGDYAVRLADNRPVIVYHDGTTDLAAGTWRELLAARG